MAKTGRLADLDGMTAMKKMVLTVFREHPEMTKGEIEQYIKDNL